MRVLGLDGFGARWVGVLLEHGRFAHADVYGDLAAARAAFPGLDCLAIDVPIGVPDVGRRQADVEARGYVGRLRSSVFLTPVRTVLEQPTYAEALACARERSEPGLSRQAYALRAKILAVDAEVAADDDVIEIHPEVCFRALAGEELPFGKRTWNGLLLRRRLLEGSGIVLPADLGRPAGLAHADDVLDAAAAAWSANRWARSEARSLPAEPPRDARGRRVAIWY